MFFTDAARGHRRVLRDHSAARLIVSGYSPVTVHPSLKLPKKHGLPSSYPEDWMKRYREKDYMDIRTVTRWILSSRKPFFWSEVMDSPELAARRGS